MAETASANQYAGSVARFRPSRFLWALARIALSVLATFIGLTLITFIIGRVMPLDPVLAIVGDRATQDVYQKTYIDLGLDRPVLVQYLIYMGKLLTGDFGVSVFSSRSVLIDLREVFPATFELSTVAIVLGVALGVPMGVISAANHGRWPDHIIRIVGLIGYSMPVFWFGIVGLQFFYGYLGWVSGAGRVDIGFQGVVEPVTGLLLIDSLLQGEPDVFWNAISHLILPAGILAYISLAYIARMTRSFMLSQLNQEYILTARAKGMSRRRVIWRHAFGNILGPLATVIALAYGALLEGAVLTETVFAWPGLGLYMKNALFNADMNAILGGTIVIGLAYIALNLLSDVAMEVFSPRV